MKRSEPVRLTPHNPVWADMYLRESGRLQTALGEIADRIEHIGSTSIADIVAKPIIDILVVASDLARVDRRTTALAAIGYEAKGEYGLAGRRYFRKCDANGVRTHHVHVYQRGSGAIERHLAFRDFLRAHPDKARRYSDLKAELASGRGLAGPDYQSAKAGLVNMLEAEALAWSGAR